MKKTKKMTMTEKLATRLMEDLACVAISATGGAVQDAAGNFSKEQMAFAQQYAKDTFCALLTDWEEKMGKEWNIE